MFTLLVVILCLAICFLTIVFFANSDVEEGTIAVIMFFLLTFLFFVIVGFDIKISEERNYYYKLGQEDAVNGRIYYQVETITIKKLN